MNATQLDKFAEPLLDQINGRRCLYLANDWMGNVGDRMIDAGTVDFLMRYKVDFLRHPMSKPIGKMPIETCRAMLLFGSGSVGQCCRNVAQVRTMAAGWGLPCILLPSSAMDTGEDLSYCEAVFARDYLSWAMLQCTRPGHDVFVMPDMASWWKPPIFHAKPKHEDGVFLRDDNASRFDEFEKRDPVREKNLSADYFKLAARYAHVKTDRLHFALASLLAGREATLLPTNWHKLRSYYQTWHEHYEGRMKWAWRING